MNLDELPIFAVLVDGSEVTVDASPAGRAILAGLTLVERADEASREKLRAALHRSRAGERIVGWEVNLTTSPEPESIATYLLDLSPVDDLVIVTGTDVTRYRQSASSAQLAAVEAVSRFAAVREVATITWRQEEDRRRGVADGLHDDVLQPLVAAELRAAMGNTVEAELRDLIQRLRRYIAGLRPFALGDGRVWDAIAELGRPRGVSVEAAPDARVAEPTATILYRVAEALVPNARAGWKVVPIASGFDLVGAAVTDRLPALVTRPQREFLQALGGGLHEWPGRWCVRLDPADTGSPSRS